MLPRGGLVWKIIQTFRTQQTPCQTVKCRRVLCPKVRFCLRGWGQGQPNQVSPKPTSTKFQGSCPATPSGGSFGGSLCYAPAIAGTMFPGELALLVLFGVVGSALLSASSSVDTSLGGSQAESGDPKAGPGRLDRPNIRVLPLLNRNSKACVLFHQNPLRMPACSWAMPATHSLFFKRPFGPAAGTMQDSSVVLCWISNLRNSGHFWPHFFVKVNHFGMCCRSF